MNMKRIGQKRLWPCIIYAGLVMTHPSTVLADQNYIFRLNSFQIFDTTSPHEDTDYAYFTVKVGDRMFEPASLYVGSHNNGLFNLGWEIGPITIAESDQVIISYQIVNNGASDQHQQVANAAATAGIISNIISGIGSGISAIPDPTFLAAGVGLAASVLAASIGAVANAVQRLDGKLNCDEPVVSDVILTHGSDLRASLVPNGLHSVVKDYRTPGRPGGLPIWEHCRTAHYAVSWSVLASYVRIDNSNSHLSMDVADASLLDGAAINQFTTNNNPNQRWRLTPAPVSGMADPWSPVTITSVNSGKVIDVPNGSRDSGVFVQQFQPNQGLNQRWQFVTQNNQSVQIINQLSGLALDVPSASTTPGTGIEQNNPTSGSNQQWLIVPDPVEP